MEKDYILIHGKIKNINKSDEKKSVGKPPLDEGDVEDDNTAASKEQGGNVSENKE